MASNLTPGFHVMSDLLTVREKGILFALLEPQCKLIKSTVAQVLVDKDTQDESPGWSCLGCGSVCLIEDKSIHTHFLRLYCVKRAKLLWEQELYTPFMYTATSTFFHTFPADGHHVGLNFAEETEAEEFHLAVEAAQRNREKMTRMSKKTNAENKTTSDPPDSGIKLLDHLDKEQHFPMDAPSPPSPPVTLTTSSEFKDLNRPMRRLSMQSRHDEKDLKDKDITEAVDCIINQFGLKAVQRELRSRGSVSQTFPRAAGGSISLALRKGPLPPVPSVKGSTASQQTPQCTDTLHLIQIPPCPPPPAHPAPPPPPPLPPPPPPPPPPPAPAPVLPERIRKSVTFKQVGSSAVAEASDPILTSLREVFRQKQLLRQRSSTDGSQM